MDFPKTYYKVTNRDEIHYDHTYTDGLNILKGPFAEHGHCVPGGFYFVDLKNIHEYYSYGCYIREITLPITDPNFKMVPDGNKYRANMVILGKRYDMYDYNTFLELNLEPPLEMMDNFIKNGNLDVLKKFMEKKLLDDHDYWFETACRVGHLNVAQWLMSISKINIHAGNDYAFRASCINGHLNVAQWLLSTSDKINIHADDDYAFRFSCTGGHLNMAQWLLSLSDEINIHTHDDYAFRFSCIHGHLDVAQWLVTIGKINIDTDKDSVFHWVCVNGHLDMAKWLLSIHGEKNIPTNNVDTFHRVCANGYLDMVEWLLSIHGEKNIPTNNVGTFHICCTRGHLNIAQILIHLNEAGFGGIKIKDIEYASSICHELGRLEMAKWLDELIVP